MKITLKSKYLFPKILLNYRCEENPPGSGNFKCDVNAQSDKDLDAKNKARLSELKSNIDKIKLETSSLKNQMKKLPRNSSTRRDLEGKIITNDATIRTMEDHIKTLSYKHPTAPIEFKPFLNNSNKVIKNLSDDEKTQLHMHLGGWGNMYYQQLLAELGGHLPDKMDEYVKQKLTRINESFDLNNEEHKNQFESQLYVVEKLVDSIKKLDSIMEKTKVPSELTVYSGISPSLEKLNNVKIGEEFNLSTFVSTSRSNIVASGFALRKHSIDIEDGKNSLEIVPTVLEMHLKVGSKALAVEDYDLELFGPSRDYVIGDKGVPGIGSQQEVLLARNTRCTVREIKQETFRGKTIRKIIVDASN